MGISFVSAYQQNAVRRKSFSELAASVFGIQFEPWYEAGYWNDRYVPFSYVEGDRVIANVSVNLLDHVIGGVTRSVIQIGTVMTHPDYRNKGLSAKLMQKVIEEFENRVDYMYLFANETVLDFYPKFGFQPVQEQRYYIEDLSELCVNSKQQAAVRKLDGRAAADLELIYRIANHRASISQLFSVEQSQGILMFYCMNVFPEHLYYIEELDMVVIYEELDGQLEIYDVIALQQPDLLNVLQTLVNSATKRVNLHFTPDRQLAEFKQEVHSSSLFVRTSDGAAYPQGTKHPMTATA